MPPAAPAAGRGPLDLGEAGWKNTLKRIGKKFTLDRWAMTTGSLAYHWFLALFPALIALLGLTSLLHISSSMTQHLVHGLESALPPGASGGLQPGHRDGGPALVRLAHRPDPRRGDRGVERLGRMAALETGLDIAYEVPADRKFAANRLYAFPLMLAMLVIGGVASLLIVFGTSIGTGIEGHIPIAGTAFAIVWNIVRWALGVIGVTLRRRAERRIRAPGCCSGRTPRCPGQCPARRNRPARSSLAGRLRFL